MIKELNHIGIRVGDIDKSVEFYTEVLGGKIVRDAKATSGDGRFVYIQISEGLIELIKGKPGASNLGLAHIAFLIDDKQNLDEAYEYLSKKGFEFTATPKLASSGDGRLSFFNETSGVSFELIERKENIRIPGLVNEHILEFDHLSIRVSDESYDRTNDFLLNEMGFKVRKILTKGATVMSYYSHGVDTVETLYTPGREKAEKPLGHMAFRVKDCFGTKKYLESMGVACGEPKESALGGFNILNINGPDGEVMEFVDRPALDKM